MAPQKMLKTWFELQKGILGQLFNGSFQKSTISQHQSHIASCDGTRSTKQKTVIRKLGKSRPHISDGKRGMIRRVSNENPTLSRRDAAAQLRLDHTTTWNFLRRDIKLYPSELQCINNLMMKIRRMWLILRNIVKIGGEEWSWIFVNVSCFTMTVSFYFPDSWTKNVVWYGARRVQM